MNTKKPILRGRWKIERAPFLNFKVMVIVMSVAQV